MIEKVALYILYLAIDTDAFLMTLFEVDGLNCAGGDGNGEWMDRWTTTNGQKEGTNKRREATEFAAISLKESSHL